MTVEKNVLLRLDAIGKVFFTDSAETHALRDISMTVSEGEFVSIGGPSGCGKSTLLGILGLMDTPTAGQYSLAGNATTGLNARARARMRNAHIGFIFQAFNLIGNISVLENVGLPLKIRGVSRSERTALAEEALDRVGMGHRRDHLPSQLSGGQQQRVAVARAVAGAPSILLADEPTGNLDSENGEAVMEVLESLHSSGATICMVTHDPRYHLRADRQISLFDGRIVR